MSLYSKRGVSAQKEEVHAATKHLDPGLFPNAFCKIYPDHLVGDANYVNVMHADGAGTKSILAYLYWKETGDISVWRSIARDAIIMNLDDLLCAGIYDNIIFNSTIDRNKLLIPGEVLQQIIDGSQEFFDSMRSFGINIFFLGGETADVGDVVRTIAVNGTMTARWPKDKIITNEKISAGDVIVGLAGFGQAAYEENYNSGIGSNGLTSARHDILSKFYFDNFKESYDNSLSAEIAYIGQHRLTDPAQAGPPAITAQPGIGVDDPGPLLNAGIPGSLDIGKLLLSPTRTFAPLIKELLKGNFNKIHGLIHCSGGGQTKCLKYMPRNLRLIKDNLFEPPRIFKMIQQASKADDREMYQVFNMGCRMEIYTDADFAAEIIRTAKSLQIEAQVIGRVEAGEVKELVIRTGTKELIF